MSTNMVGKSNATSKLALLRQSREVKRQEVDVEKAIDGFVSSIDSRTMMAEIARNSSIVNLIIDSSGSMDGTSASIAHEINQFAARQGAKLYTTKLSLTVFNDNISTLFNELDTRQIKPLSGWECEGGTNIFDALFRAIEPINKGVANHKLHLIITDGQNGYSNHTKEEVREFLKSRIDAGEHIFLLYNDYEKNSAKVYAAALGINPNNAVNFSFDGDGIKIIFQTIEDLLDGLRTKGSVPEDWAKVITAHAANPLSIKARETKYLE